jgi:hypothetical protein
MNTDLDLDRDCVRIYLWREGKTDDEMSEAFQYEIDQRPGLLVSATVDPDHILLRFRFPEFAPDRHDYAVEIA